MMQCKERLEAYLREHQVPFQVQQHARTFSAQKIAESEHIPGKLVAKTVIAWVDNQLIALVLPASYRADLNKVGELLGAKEIRLAHEPEFAATFPDCAVGSMPPFGNLYGIPVYVEQHLAEQETMVFPVGTYTETMRLSYGDFARLVHPQVMTFAHIPSLG
jgi:Ala-tRNA(Pro) deacylase